LRHASGTSFRRRIIKFRDVVVYSLTSSDLPRIHAKVRRGLKRSLHAAKTLYEGWIVWLKKRPSIVDLQSRSRAKMPVYRWLHKPWTPTLWLLSSPRFYAMRRRLTHKKV
jgi:hypothetical protein